MHADGHHGVDAELVERIAAAGICVCPTNNLRLPDPLALRPAGYTPALMSLVRAGVRIIAGTDAGVNFTPHHGYVGGLQAMAMLGMPLDDVLHAATGGAAAALGLGSVTGRLEVGMDADVIAVGGDPRTDLGALHDLRLVATRGMPFVPDALPSLELSADAQAVRKVRIEALLSRPDLVVAAPVQEQACDAVAVI